MKHLLLLLICLAATTNVFAQTGTCERALAEAYLDVNNVRARVLNNGALFWRGSPHLYEVPKYGGSNAIFAAGIWIGGMVGDDLRMTASTYGPWEFWPGPLDEAGNPPADCKPLDRIYSVYQRDITTYEATGELTSDLEDWPWALGAPVIDGDGDPDNYNLAGGDRPEIRGHQTLWWVMNDRGNVHERTDTEPIGLEVQVTAFAAASTDEDIDNATLYQYKIIYKGTAPLEDAYIGFYQDPDLGNFDDDYVGSDSTLGLGYVYNADNEDEGGEGYGTAPPAAGYDFLSGPLAENDGIDNNLDGTIDEPGERLMMTSFAYYSGGAGVVGDPGSASDFYNYMQGKWKDGQRFTVGGTGRDFSTTPTSFFYHGDPVSGEGWTELNPALDGSLPPIYSADRRSVMGMGPFTMNPGDVEEFTLGVLWARGEDNLDSITQLKEASVIVQEAFDAGFNIELPATEPLSPVQLVAPANRVGNQPTDPFLRWELLSTSTAFELQYDTDPDFTDPLIIETTHVSSTRLTDLTPFTTYYWRIRALNAGTKSPWSEVWSFSTSELAFGNALTHIAGFMTTSNAAGLLDPPDMAAFAFDSSGFPVLEGTLTPAGSYPDPLRPTSGIQQSTNNAVWGIHTGGENRRYFENAGGQSFSERSLRNGDRILGADDFEWRFTQSCLDGINEVIETGDCLAWRAFNDGAFAEVPFELWNVGTMEDSTDDYRMIPILCEEACGAGIDPLTFDIGLDHASSDGNDDPFSDWVYWYNPADSLVKPGSEGYNAFFFDETLDPGNEIFARTVLVQLDGGAAPPYDVALPEPGTTFRIVTSSARAPLLSSPINHEIRTSPSATLTWQAVPNVHFQLQIDTSPDFQEPDLTISGLNTPLYYTGDYPKNQTYYWRVQMTESDGTPLSDWSETWQFTIPLNVANETPGGLPATFALGQSYPNPFQHNATIEYSLPRPAPVKLEVYDTLGRRVRVLVDGQQPAGRHQAIFDATNLSNGTYFYRLTAGDFHDTKTMTLIR